MKRLSMVLVAGAVLVGALAPIATAQEAQPEKEAPLELEATLEDWKEFGAELEDLKLTLAAAEAAIGEEWRQDECRFQSLRRGTWTALEERLTSTCAIAKWPVSGGYDQFFSVAACESGWNRFANNSGRYLGLFQHAAPYWSGRVGSSQPSGWDKKLSTRWTNSRSQIVVTARMVHSGGWGPWGCA